MLYQLHDLQYAINTPLRLQAEITKTLLSNPFNPLSYTPAGRTIAASAELVERLTRRFGKPEFGLPFTTIDGKQVAVHEEIIAKRPFGQLVNFKRACDRNDPKVLLVAPLSGHYATLLRGTIEGLLPHHNVFVTDWADARQVPLNKGSFDLDSYISYLREYLAMLGPDVHVMAVCQPAVPVLATVALMASENDPNQPLSMTLMGGPIDTRVSKTQVTDLAEQRPISWFEKMAVHTVPFYYPGGMRKVYPGFLQLTGFMTMNLDRHMGSYMNLFKHLVQGDGQSADKHREFYNEYLAVMDIPAEFYLQTVETVFIKHSLPRGLMEWKDETTGETMRVRPQDIKRTALLTVEGERDDISARGQTTAAHEICYSLPQSKQYHHLQIGTGHYGIFNGRKYRQNILPRIRWFMRQQDPGKDAVPAADLEATGDLRPVRYDRDQHGIAATRRQLREQNSEFYKAFMD